MTEANLAQHDVLISIIVALGIILVVVARRLDAAMAAMRVAASILEQAGDELEAAGVVCNKIEVARLLLSSIDATPPHDPKGDD